MGYYDEKYQGFDQRYYQELETPLGIIYLVGRHTGIMGVHLNDDFSYPFMKKHPCCYPNEAEQIEGYFAGKITRPKLSQWFMDSTDFQLQVWNEICGIEYGATMTYQELAAKIGNPKAYRAVAKACAANPFPLFFPCHRVIGAGGKLCGFVSGLEHKKFLLKFEQENAINFKKSKKPRKKKAI